MYLVHIYAYPYKYTYIQVLMAQNSCISQPYTSVIEHTVAYYDLQASDLE